MGPQILAYPANVRCPGCGDLVHDWHTEWTDPTFGPDFYKGVRAIDCPLCGAWVLFKDRQIQASPVGSQPQKSKRLALQAARWAKSQTKQGNLRDYLDQSGAGKQYKGYFTDQDVQEADADASGRPEVLVMLLSDHERQFLAAFIYEATTDPFKGPATDDLRRRNIYYDDIPHLMTAYYQENSAAQEGFGGAYDSTPPPCPWEVRVAALRRDREVQAELDRSQMVTT